MEERNNPILVNVPIDDEEDPPTIDNMDLKIYFDGVTPLVTIFDEFPKGFPIPLKFVFNLLYTLPVRSSLFSFILWFISMSLERLRSSPWSQWINYAALGSLMSLVWTDTCIKK